MGGVSVSGSVDYDTSEWLKEKNEVVTLLDSSEGCAQPDNSYFDHWECSYTGEGGNPYYANGDEGNGEIIDQMPPYAVTCNANWECDQGYHLDNGQCVINTHTVTYHGGNCNQDAGDVSVTVNNNATYTVLNPYASGSSVAGVLPDGTCRRFKGWSTNSNLTDSTTPAYSCNTDGSSCGTLTANSNVDLYAVCENIQYNVVYHSGNCVDGNSISYTASNVLNNGSGYSVLSLSDISSSDSTNASTWNGIGSEFQGWFSADEPNRCASSSSSWSGQVISISDPKCNNVNLYALCCPVNLYWDIDGGSWPQSGSNQTTCSWNATAGNTGSINPLYKPTKAGHTFNGWVVTGHTYP